MSKIDVSNCQVNNSLNENASNMHYIGVMFESRYDSTLDNPKFYGKVYEYKTTKNLKEGEVIYIETQYGKSRVCVIKENIPENELESKELDKIVEI